MKQNIEERDPSDPMCCPNCGEEIADADLYGYTGRRAGSVRTTQEIQILQEERQERWSAKEQTGLTSTDGSISKGTTVTGRPFFLD